MVHRDMPTPVVWYGKYDSDWNGRMLLLS